MPDALGWTRLALGAAGTVVYFLVGFTVGQRRTSREGSPGMRAFQLWWYGLGVLTLFSPLLTLLDAVPGSGQWLTLRILLLNAVLVLLMAAVAGLLYYLFYVYTGKPWIAWPIAAYAWLETAWLMTIIQQAHVIGYGPGCPQGTFCYEFDLTGSPASTWVGLSFIVPILVAAIGYFALYFRVERRAQKLRVAMVGGALVDWFATSLVASLVKVAGTDPKGQPAQIALSQHPLWSSIVSPTVGLVASLVILWAYRLRTDDELPT